jgi:hypothetical protein
MNTRRCNECGYKLDDGYLDTEDICGACVNVAEGITPIDEEEQ